MRYARAMVSIVCAGLAGACGAASDAEVAPPAVHPAGAEAGTSPVLGDSYAIRLTSPSHRGQRGRLRSESEEASVKRLRHRDGAEESEATSRRVVVRGVHEIVDVSPDGRALSVQLDVETLTAEHGDDRPRLSLDRGRIRVERAEREADAVVTIDGRPADAALRSALSTVISLTLATAPSDDAIFGTTVRQRIGQSWPIQAEVARQSLSDGSMALPEGAVSGVMRLVGVDKHVSTGIECAEIVGKMSVSPFELIDGPPGARTERGKIVVLTRAVVPIDANLPRLEDEMTMSTEITMSIPGAGVLDLTSRKATHSAYEPLPANPGP